MVDVKVVACAGTFGYLNLNKDKSATLVLYAIKQTIYRTWGVKPYAINALVAHCCCTTNNALRLYCMVKSTRKPHLVPLGILSKQCVVLASRHIVILLRMPQI